MRGVETLGRVWKRERECDLCLFFSFSLPLFLFIDLWEEIYDIAHKNKCSQACISSPHNCITKKKKKKYYVPQQKQCWMIPTADNAQWWRLSRPWPVTLVLPQNLGFKKSQQRGIGWEKESKQQKDSFAFNKWYLHSVKTSFTKHWF